MSSRRRHLAPFGFAFAVLLATAASGCRSDEPIDPTPETSHAERRTPPSSERTPAIPPAAGEAESAAETPIEGDDGGGDARGRYLAERVAMCIQCHSPRRDDGELVLDRKFEGAAMPVDAPPDWPREWAVETPALAGLAFYSRAEFVRLLTRGIARDGEPPAPPMPPFRMTPDDAAAIYDYLSGLPQAPPA